MSIPHNKLDLPKPLGEGLVLRLSTSEDVEAIATLNERVLLEAHEPPHIFSAWTKDLMSGRHPTCTPTDFVVVEDTQTGKLVSSTGLIPQTWQYEDISIPAGRPEMVVTDSAYRRRGLVRAVIQEIHALSAAYGHLVQGITGIPWFYRQFGYEYALVFGGWRNLALRDIPKLKEDESEPYQVRPATAADIPTLQRLYQRSCAGKLVTSQMTEARWLYDLQGHQPESIQAQQFYCITTVEGRVIGYYQIPGQIWRERIGVWHIAVDAGISLAAVLPTVLRSLHERGTALAAQANPDAESLLGIRFMLPQEHPVYEVLAAKLGPSHPPYAWYIRVPDLPKFIRHIAPVLERRLVNSPLSGFGGEVKLTFYRSGLRLTFEQGKLREAVDWQAPETNQKWEGAGFPPLVFLQLLFGHRSLDELRYAFPDCWADDEAALLLKILFPKQDSWLFPLG
jgi:hypothetical protein